MHYGRRFIYKAKIRYTSDIVKVSPRCGPNELLTYSLLNWYSNIEKHVPYAKFWYSLPNHDLDVGVISINDDVNIELQTSCYEALPYMHIYVELNEAPLRVLSPDGKSYS